MKISVIIPCHGAGLWLGAQLEALAAQEWSGDWEVILADNGVSPDVRGMVETYADRLPRLRIIDAGEKPGSANARNRGAAAAGGDALIFVDSDDVVGNGWLSAMAAALERYELCAPRFEYGRLSLHQSNDSEHYAQEKGLQRLWYPPWVEHAGGCGLGVWSTTHEAIGGFDEDLLRLQDTEYCIRSAEGGIPLTFVPDAVIHIRLRDNAHGRLRQARDWARINCQLYRRYGRRQLDARHAWREYGVDSLRLVRRLLHVRRRSAWLRLGARFGRQLGLLEGSIRYRVPPPVMPHERSIGPAYPVPDGSTRVAEGGRLRHRRRSRLRTLVRVRTQERKVALTFDDGPDPVYTPRLLRILERHGARATFFLIGKRAEQFPEIVRQIADEGHTIGNHTYSHRPLPELSTGEQAMELERCRQALGESAARLFRPPYGQQSEASYRAARRAGNEVVGWSVMSGDWRFQKADELAAAIVEQLEPGAIVLLHDALHEPRDPAAANRQYSLDAVDQVLSRVGSYTQFVTVPELLASGKAMRLPWFTRRRSRFNETEQVLPKQDRAPSLIEGRLRLGVFGPGQAVEPEEFTTQWMRGPDYGEIQDCDIRGFLDGGVRWAWNQPGQIHVRVGRLGWRRRPDRAPEHGERELFRCLHRWDGLDLPDSVEVLDASLTLHVEAGAPRPVDVCLYEVFRDWNPGQGGVWRNNVSIPAAGEVWWNEAEAERSPWSKPGAGQAGDPASGADTPETVLAAARYQPGDSSLTFRSAELAAYAQRRTSAGEPLLLLIKLSDVDEDSEGSVLTFWSAEHGDDYNTATRPRLTLKWRSRAQVAGTEVDVCLERGRPLSLPPLAGGPDRTLVVEWTGAGLGGPPTVQLRGAGEEQWREGWTISPSLPAGTRLRLLAARHPVELGREFRTGIEDTWVTSGPPEEQIVEWGFVSPSGVLHRLESSYRGGCRWEIEFRPNEIGTWRYYWRHTLAGEVVHGPPGRFDVVGGDPEYLMEHLESLAGEVSAGMAEARQQDLRSWEQRLMTLERAVVVLTSAREWSGDRGAHVRDQIRQVRSALWGRPIPVLQPRVSHDLVTEVDGRPLLEPYPAFSAGSKDPRWRRGARRLRRRLSRLVR